MARGSRAAGATRRAMWRARHLRSGAGPADAAVSS